MEQTESRKPEKQTKQTEEIPSSHSFEKKTGTTKKQTRWKSESSRFNRMAGAPSGDAIGLSRTDYCPDLPGGLGLPETGTLFFFYDAEEMPWEGEGEEKRHRAVIYTLESLPETVRSSGGRPPFGEVFLTFEQMETFPPDDDSFEENDDKDTVERGAHHQMLGYPVYIQDEDMTPGKILLLQLDTDDDTGWMWGDMGMIYFWIAPQELDARNFDDVRLVLECS